jgi:hypothetical protein
MPILWQRAGNAVACSGHKRVQTSPKRKGAQGKGQLSDLCASILTYLNICDSKSLPQNLWGLLWGSLGAIHCYISLSRPSKSLHIIV